MPPSTVARQSHHLNESAQEAAFHRAALRETRALNRTLSSKEKKPTKQTAQISKNGQVMCNADSGLHERTAEVATKPSSCFSCFLLPVKKAKEVSRASTYRASTKSSRDKTLNGSKANTVHNNSCSAMPLSQMTPVNITSKPLSDVTKTMQNTIKASPISMNKPQAVSQGRIKNASSMSSSRPQEAETLGKVTGISNPIGPHKPQVAPTGVKTCSKPTPISFIKPHLALRSSSKSSPPMNISNPRSAETLGHITRKSSPMSPINGKSILEMRSPFPKQSAHAFHLQKGPRAVRFTEPSEGEMAGSTKKRIEVGMPTSNGERRVVWREGLLQRLGRLHGLGNCKLSLEELIELDDNACLEELERLQEYTSPNVIFTQARSSSTRPSIASTWNMEFEGGKPILPLQRQDVSPELVHCVWPFSHTNCLFEASTRHHGNYSHERCK